jgi:hypothetical protein
MNLRTSVRLTGAAFGALVLFLHSGAAIAAEGTPEDYPRMAPIEHYLAASEADEIALARSAAPPTISQDAKILTLSARGYATALPGKSQFVCLVERSWAKNFDSTEFWNPKIRAPHCFNAAAARSVLPAYLKRTEWVISGVSRQDMLMRTKAELAMHHIPAPEVGAIAFMMSKQGYLGDDAHGPWHPHVMFYLPRTDLAAMGANVSGSPILGDSSGLEPVTVFFVPVAHWSDGTRSETAAH